MRSISTIIPAGAGLVCITLLAGASEAGAQYRYAQPGFSRPSPMFFYRGLRGYSVSGWELGRMQSMRRYGPAADPGPWPGWRGAVFGR